MLPEGNVEGKKIKKEPEKKRCLEKKTKDEQYAVLSHRMIRNVMISAAGLSHADAQLSPPYLGSSAVEGVHCLGQGQPVGLL